MSSQNKSQKADGMPVRRSTRSNRGIPRPRLQQSLELEQTPRRRNTRPQEPNPPTQPDPQPASTQPDPQTASTQRDRELKDKTSSCHDCDKVNDNSEEHDDEDDDNRENGKDEDVEMVDAPDYDEANETSQFPEAYQEDQEDVEMVDVDDLVTTVAPVHQNPPSNPEGLNTVVPPVQGRAMNRPVPRVAGNDNHPVENQRDRAMPRSMSRQQLHDDGRRRHGSQNQPNRPELTEEQRQEIAEREKMLADYTVEDLIDLAAAERAQNATS